MAKDYAHMGHAELLAEVERLDNLINTPHTADFLEAVRLEAGHQADRWGSAHDAGKSDIDWLWLLAYLSGKAVHAGNRFETFRETADADKRLHHVVTTAAACLNWHAQLTGMPLNPLAPMRAGTGAEE